MLPTAPQPYGAPVISTHGELIQPFALTSFALSLLLLFRTNSAYGRWVAPTRRSASEIAACRVGCCGCVAPSHATVTWRDKHGLDYNAASQQWLAFCRWWEARTQMGLLYINVRSIVRMVGAGGLQSVGACWYVGVLPCRALLCPQPGHCTLSSCRSLPPAHGLYWAPGAPLIKL